MYDAQKRLASALGEDHADPSYGRPRMERGEIYLLMCAAIDTLRVVRNQPNAPDIHDLTNELNRIARDYQIMPDEETN
jgi:hypothetical protein